MPMPIPIRMVVLLTLFALTKDSFFHARTPPQQSRTSTNINEHQITLGFNRLCQESNSGSNGRLDAIFALTRLFRLGRTPAQQSTINNEHQCQHQSASISMVFNRNPLYQGAQQSASNGRVDVE
jgi:hypothetical protein